MPRSPKHKEILLDRFEQMQKRKARPDFERICHMLHQRHGLSKSDVQEEINLLVDSEAVVTADCKRHTIYRNATKLGYVDATQGKPQPRSSFDTEGTPKKSASPAPQEGAHCYVLNMPGTPMYRKIVLDTIDHLRKHITRPDFERICHVLYQRHGLSKAEVQEELNLLVNSGAVNNVDKGNTSYRNTAKWVTTPLLDMMGKIKPCVKVNGMHECELCTADVVTFSALLLLLHLISGADFPVSKEYKRHSFRVYTDLSDEGGIAAELSCTATVNGRNGSSKAIIGGVSDFNAKCSRRAVTGGFGVSGGNRLGPRRSRHAAAWGNSSAARPAQCPPPSASAHSRETVGPS
ncbi:hypothetical protein MRX96_058293 [Rhipicephalus microplus]